MDDTTARQRHGPSPALAAFASAIVPGLGQLLVGRRKRGIVLLLLTAVATGWVAMLVLARPVTVAVWSVQPVALRWLLVVNGVALAFRVYAAADAFVVAGGRFSPGASLLGVGGLAALGTAAVLVVPHAVAGYYDVVEYDLITTVFQPIAATTTTVATTAPPPSTTAIPPAATAANIAATLPPTAAPTTTTTTTTTTT
ncbi:MAG: hypothetical protein ACE5GC_05565, partial [Acidimicrobiia bacterium]